MIYADLDHVSKAIAGAQAALPNWQALAYRERANKLDALADCLEENLVELVALCHMEAGKTIHDSIDEVREAVDFCRFYAKQSEVFNPQTLTDFNGQSFTYQRGGLGVIACISPWNFPLAIFLGQIVAAAVSGNTVVAKPAEQTSLIACRAVELIKESGFPAGVVQLVPGIGAEIGQKLTSDERIAGVAFTGSTLTAQKINQTLAYRNSDPVPMIAETGGAKYDDRR